MSEEVQSYIDDALETAIATGADLEEVEASLDDAKRRIKEVRQLRGENDGR